MQYSTGLSPSNFSSPLSTDFRTTVSNKFTSMIGGGNNSLLSGYNKLSVYTILINLSIVYSISSVYYILMTYLSEDEYKRKKNKKHFYLGLLIGVIVVLYIKPCKTIY